MKTTRLLGLAFLALLVVSAMTATTATAFPEFKELPSPRTFTSKGGVGKAETSTGENIECETDSGTGEITGRFSVGKIFLRFGRCLAKVGGKTCTIKSTNTTV